jgi:uncharacterized cofD-like protein
VAASQTGLKAVAIGGGTGLPIVLKALKGWSDEITAIVTMADDGGSSGKLRQELGILPPGDIRNCLAALAADEKKELVEILQYRFPTGWSLAEHSLGNLIIAGMADYKGGFAEAVEALSGLLGVNGQVLPSTLDDVNLFADTGGGSILAGQAAIARTEQIRQVHLEPSDAEAYPPAVQALKDADLIVFGPGSLFTSLLPNLLIHGVAEAVLGSRARKVFILNIMNMRRETFSMSGEDYLEALTRHVPLETIDTIVAHGERPLESIITPEGETALPVEFDLEPVEALGLQVVIADLADEAAPLRHDPVKLAGVLRQFFKGVRQ